MCSQSVPCGAQQSNQTSPTQMILFNILTFIIVELGKVDLGFFPSFLIIYHTKTRLRSLTNLSAEQVHSMIGNWSPRLWQVPLAHQYWMNVAIEPICMLLQNLKWIRNLYFSFDCVDKLHIFVNLMDKPNVYYYIKCWLLIFLIHSLMVPLLSSVTVIVRHGF